MGVIGTKVKIQDIELQPGEDITIKTSTGLEIFICFEDEQLTISNESEDGNYPVMTVTKEGFEPFIERS